MDVKVGQTVPLGVFADSLNFVAFATLAKYQVSIEKDKLDYLVANSTSFIRASNRLLFAYIYATYESQKDLDWLRIASQQWANDIISVNPSAVLAGKDQDATFNSSFNWDKVFSKAIAAAVVGGLFALISSIFRRKKTSVDTKKDGDA